MRRTLLVVALLGLLISGCGDVRDHVTDQRVDQVREAALAAGLSDEVADVLSLAARGTTATFQITYAGTGGASLTVSQDPPNRRIDVLTAGLIVESQVVRDGVSYRCDLPDGASPGDELDCTRTQGALPALGGFSDEAIATFTDDLLGAADELDLTVEKRSIAGTAATCLITAPKAGTPLDGTGPGVDTICLSPDGAQLLVDSGGERVVADAYSTDVPGGTFDV